MQIKSIAECSLYHLIEVKSIAECSKRALRSKVLQNAQREHSAILLTCIKLPSVFKTFVLSIFERPLKTDFFVVLV